MGFLVFSSMVKQECTYDSSTPEGAPIKIIVKVFKQKVVVGQKVIPATILPAREETVIPEHVESIIEWVCPPVLERESRS